jgi:FKBP-type peptidyl-prolyl cis-trans isomerase
MEIRNTTVIAFICAIALSVNCALAQYQQVNPLRVLGLNMFVSSKHIKDRCRKLLKDYHRDKGGSDEVAQRITAACDDLDWRGKDSCTTDGLVWGTPCNCPTTGTVSLCVNDFIYGRTRCNCKLSTDDDTVVPDLPASQKPTYHQKPAPKPTKQAKPQRAEPNKPEASQHNTYQDQQKTASDDQQQEKKESTHESYQEQQKTAYEQYSDTEQQDVPGQKTTFASGLIKEILVPAPHGAARPNLGQTVVIGYTVWIQNKNKQKGRIIDQTDDSGIYSSVKIIVGKAPVNGLNEALLLMKVGETSRFILPPSLVQGYQGDRFDASKTTLIYEIKLISIL